MKNTKNTTGRRVYLHNPSGEYRKIKKDIDSSLLGVLSSGKYAMGRQVEEFEKELSRYLGIKYTLGISSGTDALTIAIKALNLKAKDEVIVPANVYPTAFGVSLAGVGLRLCDVDEDTLNLSLNTVKKAITSRTKAVVAVHLYGNPADIVPIKDYLGKKGIYLIEDCAHAMGAELSSKKTGTFGDIGILSFYPTKNLGGFGEGGAIVTNNERIARRAKLLRVYGEKERYRSLLVGHNARMDEIQAAFLKVKLKYLDTWNKLRRKKAESYKNVLKGVSVYPLEVTKDSKPVYHLFVARAKKRDSLVGFLNSSGIEVGVHYPSCIHEQTSFYNLGYKKESFKVSEKACREIISLPLYPFLSRRDFRYIVGKIKEFYS